MLTLFHSPQSRSTRIIRLLQELDALDQVNIKVVTIIRDNGTGCVDPANPHSEGKVPLLVHDGCEIRESNAIILYLTDLIPSSLAPAVGSIDRGAYLSWLAYYGNVLEPVLIHQFAELNHPALQTTFRGMSELTRRLADTLDNNEYLLGDQFSAADLLMVSPFNWFPDLAPDNPSIRRWLERCQVRPSAAAAEAFDKLQIS